MNKVWLDVRKAQKAGLWLKAARMYVAIVDKYPRHRHAAPALWNAALLYTRVGKRREAIKIYARILRQYPRSKLADQVHFRLAIAAERSLRLQKAISHYSALVRARRFSKSRHRADALRNLGLLLESLQQYQKAAATFVRFASQFRAKDANVAASSLFHGARLYAKAGQTEKAVRMFKKLLRHARVQQLQARLIMRAHGEIMELRLQQGRSFAAMEPIYKRVVGAFRRQRARLSAAGIAITRKYAAKARYMLVMEEYRRFLALKLTSRNPKKLKRQVKKKLEAYDNVAKKFGEVGRYRSAPWMLCAVVRIAEGKMKIAAAIKAMPAPRRPGASAGSSYRTPFHHRIDAQFIMPLEKDGLKKYRMAVVQSQRLQVENRCTREAQRALHRADPKSPPHRASRPRLRFRTLSPMPLITALPSKKPARR